MQPQAPLIIYHRGRHGRGIRAKENTIEAFERAIKEGAAMVEFDVWAGLRVAHDPGENSSAPTLPEVLEAIRARCAVNIEIKSPQALKGVLNVIDDALTLGCWTENRIVVSSFHHSTALDVKGAFPELRVGVINDGVLEPPYIEWLARQGINNLHLGWANIYMDIENDCTMRSVARANNMQIWVWTVNTKEIFDTVVGYGAEAIFTDKPQLFR
ncbi:MAG: glycerophosphodiester phosphodiesterase [bacterium]|nr:glycerophosphodiester phosphodiesterase [bacterium]